MGNTGKPKKIIPYSHHYVDNSDIQAVVKVLKSERITQGASLETFEEKLAKYVDAKYAVAVASGTAALHLACLAAGIGSGDEVIVPTLSFVATANCVLYCGAKPVLVDVYEDTLTINVEEVEKKITEKTKAIVAVDFAGHPADWYKLKRLTQRYKLVLIDDAAHALGSKYRGKTIGSIADLTCFSFHPVKTITTGEGGMITTNNKSFYEKLIILRHHGIIKNKNLSRKFGPWRYEIKNLGYNYRLTDLQAALGLSQLRKISKFISRRRTIWQKYNQALGKINWLETPTEKEGCFAVWNLFPIRIKKDILGLSRRQVFNKLIKAGLGVQVHYIPIHLYNYYKKRLGYKTGDFSVAEKFYNEEISLPLYPDMTNSEVNYVIATVKNVLNKIKG